VTAVILLSLLSFVTTAAGVVLAVRARREARAIAAGIGFAAGLMILLSVAELLPRAVSITAPVVALAAAAAGAALIWLAHFLIPHAHLVIEGLPESAPQVRSAYLIVLGLLLHDVPEGFAMANDYIASPPHGVATAIAIALHNLPEEFAMAVPVAVLGSRRALFGAALLSGLAEPVGAVIGLVAVGLAPVLHGTFLALAAGAMLFVSLHELVPMARRYGNRGAFVFGAAASAPVYALLGGLAARLAI
jgi:ZIP family zinc transporter